MKKLIRFSATALGLLILLGVSAGAIAQTSDFYNESTFPDVGFGHSYSLGVRALFNDGIVEGYGDDRFKPERAANRAESMKILVLSSGASPDAAVYKSCFPDVNEDWYARYVCYAKEKGWVAGYPDGLFHPERITNRVEAVKMIVNAWGWNVPATVTTQLFDDTNNSQWYAPYLATAKAMNILDVVGGNYNPTVGVERGVMVEAAFRAIVIRDVNAPAYSPEAKDKYLELQNIDGYTEAPVVPVVVVDGIEEPVVEEPVVEEPTTEEPIVEDADGTLHIHMDVNTTGFVPNVFAVNVGQRVVIDFGAVHGDHRFLIPELDVNVPVVSGESISFIIPPTTRADIFRFYSNIGNDRKMGFEGIITVRD